MADQVQPKKIRVVVAIGDEKLTIPISPAATIKALKEEIQNRAKLVPSLASVTVTELKLKKTNSLLFDGDEVGDVVSAEEELVVPTSAPAPAQPPKPEPPAESDEDESEEKPADGEDEDEEEHGSQDIRPTRVVTADYMPPETLLFPKSEENIELNYQTALSTKVETLRVSLGLTLTALKEMIATKANVDIKTTAIDLHNAVTPIFATGAMHALTLAQLGFGNFTQHNYLKYTNLEKESEFDTTVYVVFRKITEEKQRYTAIRPAEGELRFTNSAAWHPYQCKQSDAGISAFLSGLMVLTAHLTNDTQRFLGHVCRRLEFPPAVSAIAYLLKKKPLYDEQKTALATAFFQFMKKFVPNEVATEASKLFESSIPGLSFLASFVETNDINRIGPLTEVSMTDPLNFARILDPVTLPAQAGASAGPTKIYTRQSLLARMEGGAMFVKSSPYSSLSPDSLQVDTTMKFLLANLPFSDETVLCPIVKTKKRAAAGAADVEGDESLQFDWSVLLRKLSSDEAISFMNLISPLALRRAKVPSLTLDSQKRVCVYLGPEPCSTSTVMYFIPCRPGGSESVDPNVIAKRIGSAVAQMSMASERVTNEAIIVCLDASSSMCGYSFSKDDTASEAAGGNDKKFKVAEIHAELQRLRDDEYLGTYKRMARKKPQSFWIAQVLTEIGAASPLREALVKNHANAVREILLQGDAPAEDDSDDEDEVVKNADPTEMYQIFVKSMTGKTITIDVDPKFSIKDVKASINSKTQSPNQAMRLIFGGKHLNDNQKLSDLEIRAGSTLFQAYDFSRTQVTKETYSVRDRYGRSYSVTAKNNITVLDLKFKIWDQIGERPSNCSLWTNLRSSGDGYRHGTLLNESLPLHRYKIDVIDIDVPYKRDDSRMTRMQTVKQLFHAFVNRCQAYDYATQIGLIIFDSNVDYTCPLTQVLEDFRDHVEEASAEGETKLYDALKKAAKELIEFKKENENTRLRILCLTDGEDTKSSTEPAEIAGLLQSNEITCDSIMIGEGANNKTLRAISKCTSGYAFAPKTLADALKLNELETLLTLFERPELKSLDIVKTASQLNKYADLWVYPWDICNDETVPIRRVPAALKAAVLPLDKTVSKLGDQASEGGAVKSEVKGRERRIMKELGALMRNPHPGFDIYPNRDDISFWKMVMVAPDGSPYRGGTWLMYISFPPAYPLSAPEIRFVTPIRHCNVNHYGKICHSIFTRNWTADTTMSTVLACIFGLLLNPDTDDPLDSTLALAFFDNNGQYEASIMSHVAKHASSKDRAAWKREFVADDTTSGASSTSKGGK